MRFLFSTGSLYTYSVARCFEFAAQAGFDGVELVVDECWDTRQPEYLQCLMQSAGVAIHAVHAPLFPVAGWPNDEPERIRRTAALAEAVGAGVVVHHLPLKFDYGVWTVAGKRYFVPLLLGALNRRYRRWLCDGYAAFQETTPVKLCIENMPAQRSFRRWNAHCWNTLPALRRFAALTLDVTHLGTWGLDPVNAYRQLRDRVQHIHLSNFNGREHLRPESGDLDLAAFVAHLAADGYAGAVTVELNPRNLEAGSDDARIVALLATSLRHCRAWAGGSVS
ncbi:MAG: sugar phosphate isomerase/epimerase [Anaerolineae bacterium]|nr:sugar phosphate isomerase/epimerase [Anaerolineae bacterium]